MPAKQLELLLTPLRPMLRAFDHSMRTEGMTTLVASGNKPIDSAGGGAVVSFSSSQAVSVPVQPAARLLGDATISASFEKAA